MALRREGGLVIGKCLAKKYEQRSFFHLLPYHLHSRGQVAKVFVQESSFSVPLVENHARRYRIGS
jgi:hypothetical protein